MTNRVIKICNFVHYFFREGGYIDSDQFSLLLFSLFMVGGGVQMEIVPNSLFPLFFFLAGFPKYLELARTLLYPEFFIKICCWSIELIKQEQIKPLKYMIIVRSEGKFLWHFKEAAPLAVSTFGSKNGHLTLRMILHSSS